MEGKERPKEEADHSRLVGGGLISKGSYLRTCLWCSKISRSLHLPTRILKVYIEALSGFSYIFSPNDFKNPLLPPGSVLETTPSRGMSGRKYIPGTGEGVRSLWFPRPSLQVTGWSCSPNNLPQHSIPVTSFCNLLCPPPVMSWEVSKGLHYCGGGMLGSCLAALETNATATM